MINEHYTHEAVILANGEYPVHPLPLQVLADAKYVVCCDGAANEYISRGHTPDIIIGDGDSLLPEYKKRFSSIKFRIRRRMIRPKLFIICKVKAYGKSPS